MLSRLPITKLFRFHLWHSLLVLSFCGLASLSHAAKNANEQQVQQLKKDISSLESQLQNFQTEEGKLAAELRKLERQGASLHQQLQVTQQQISDSEKRLTDLSAEKTRLNDEKQVQQTVLAGQLESAFRMGRQDQMKVLLNQQDPQRLARMMRYYRYLNSSRIETIEHYQQTLTDLQSVEQAILATQHQLQDEQQILEKKSEQLITSRRQREKLLSALKTKIANTDQRLKTDRARLQELLSRLRRTLDKNDLSWESQEFKQLKGKLSWPTQGKVVSRFGSKAQQGIASEGIIISARAGRTVNSVHHGRVVFADWLRGYGLLIIIDHGGGYMSLYGHNQSLQKTVGDWVNANEPIASVGDTGGQQTAGLYFAIRYQGQPYNPRPWLMKSSG